MKLKRVAFSLITSLAIIGLGMARDSRDRSQFGQVCVFTFPVEVVVDVYSAPVVSTAGDVAFVSSVMNGSLISFSVASGKILSSVAFGEIAGLVTMIETNKRRVIALPTANDPDRGKPATVNIVNATSADRLERQALVQLPGDVHFTPNTRALLSADARFGVVASSFNHPTLFAFSVETGKLTSTLKLPGWPSEMALYDGKTENSECLVGVMSVEANMLSVVKLDRLGRLSLGKSFSPNGMSFDISNNPAFSADGQIVYVAVYYGGHVFSIDTQKGTILGMIKLASPPQRITVDTDQNGSDLIGITRVEPPTEKKSGGVTILASNKGQFTVKTEFTPPDNIQFSRVNNVVFDADASLALVASINGTLFAFDIRTGELDSYKAIGKGVGSITLNARTRVLIALRTTPKTDEVVIIGFHQSGEGVLAGRVTSRAVLEIKEVTVIGTQLRIWVEGLSFGKGSVVEFVKAGDVVFRQTPVIKSDRRRLAIMVPIRKIEALGRFELRVVSGDKAVSSALMIEPSTLLSGLPVDPRGSATMGAVPSPEAAVEKASAVIKAPHSFRAATVVQSVRVLPANGGIRVFVETNGEARFQVFTLTDPWRVVVDIVSVRSAVGNKTIAVDSKMIQRVRVGQPRPGVVRVVLDTTGPVRYSVTRDQTSLVVETVTADTQPPTGE